MQFWKTLFGKKTPGKRLTPATPMDEEIRRLDVMEAIDPKATYKEYWRTLHPLVQACHLSRVGWEHEKELSFTASDGYNVFYCWENSVDTYMTDHQKELMGQYDSIRECLLQQKKEAEQRFAQIEGEFEEKRKQAWQDYWAHYETLSPQMQALVAWELARRGASQGMSGFHGMAPGLPFPFHACGWSTCQDPRWKSGETWGAAFRVNRDCFGDRKPLLYYLDGDNWPWAEGTSTDLEIIRQYSSGITGVHVENRWCKSWDGKEGSRQVVLFELDPAAVKKSVRLSGKDVPTADVGEYIFVLPRAGEFNCLLGEVRDGELIPLHHDSFCMK